MSDSYKVYASQEYVDNKIKEIDTSVDWNAKEGEPGYVENRTHYEEGSGIYKVNLYWQGDESIAIDVCDGMLMGYRLTRVTDKIIAANDLKDFKSTMIFEGSPIEADSYEWYHLNGDWLCRIHYPTGNKFYDLIDLGYFATTGNKADLFNLDPSATEVITEVIVSNTGLYNAANLAFTAANGKLEEVIYDFGEYTIKTLDPKYLAAAPNKSKTTILPKITLTVSDSDNPGDGVPITTPFAEYPSAGDIWNITYNGIEYACELIDASTIPDIELPFPEGALYIGGNLTATGFEHIASNNDAPFVIMAVGSEEFAVGMEAYGMIMPIVTLDQTFTVSITKGSQMAPSQLTLRSNGEMVWEEKTHWIESGGVVELIPVKEYTREELETQMA